MHFVVRHRSTYRYDVPVTLGPHIVRLTPRREHVMMRDHRVRVVPEPARTLSVEDAYGNTHLELEFAATCKELVVDSALELDTLPRAPLPTSLPPLPWPIGEQASLGYLGRRAPDPSVRQFAEALASAASYAPVPFLDRLSSTLHERIAHEVRTSGDANPAAETLASGRGACRDVTVLFVETCRCLGLPSRFVSGYQTLAASGGSQHDLHAWPEVFLPGAGFSGWDPTHGRRAAEDHVALSAAPEQTGTMPIEGKFSFHGPIARSTLDFFLSIDAS